MIARAQEDFHRLSRAFGIESDSKARVGQVFESKPRGRPTAHPGQGPLKRTALFRPRALIYLQKPPKAMRSKASKAYFEGSTPRGWGTSVSTRSRGVTSRTWDVSTCVMSCQEVKERFQQKMHEYFEGHESLGLTE